MGVGVEEWRARIGSFCSRFKSTITSKPVCIDVQATLVFASFVVLCLLLLCGDVEVNPGPVEFKCKHCPFICHSIGGLILHQRLHQNLPKFAFYCPLCSYMYFKTFNALNIHVSYQHAKDRKGSKENNAANAESQVACTVTGCAVTVLTASHLLSHLESHFLEKHDVFCPIGDCSHAKKGKPFPKHSTLKTHLSQYHPGWNSKLPKVVAPCLSSNISQEENDTEEYFDDMDSHYDDSNEFAGSSADNPLQNDDLVYKAVASMYLQLEADSLVPAETVQTLCESLIFISDLVQARIKDVLIKELESKMEEDAIRILLHKVRSVDPLYSTHHKSAFGPSLTSGHLRKTFYQVAFGYTDPDEITVSADPETQKKVLYISLKSTLKTLLEDPSVQAEVDDSFERRKKRQDEKLSDYCDGSVYKDQNPVFEKTIEIIAFQDSFRVVNPIGSSKKKKNYHILGTYMTLGNFKPQLRSKLKSIRLILLFRDCLTKLREEFEKHRNANPFQPMIDDINDLETNGIDYKGERVKVKLICMLGDNLGSHMIGGFQQQFTAGCICRYCTMKLQEFRREPDGIQQNKYCNPLRTHQQYLAAQETLKSTNVKNCRGVKRECVLKGIHTFNPVDQLPPCLAHDILEGGVVDRDLASIIHRLVALDWFDYDWLNKRIDKFSYGPKDINNKPAPVNESGVTLGGHAVQNWTLLRLFPLIILDKIKDTTIPEWQLFLNLQKLMEYLCAPSFTKEALNYLDQVLIPSYMDLRVSVFGASTLQPKHHFMSHYVGLILKFGPLFYLWTLRFESFHSFFKQVARYCHNFINIEKTLALKYQLRSVYLSTGELFSNYSSVKSSSPFNLQNQGAEVINALRDLNLSPSTISAQTLTFEQAITYSVGNVVLLSSDGSNSIQVGMIHSILCDGSEEYFLLKIYIAEYSNESGLYLLPEISEGLSAISIKTLSNPEPVSTYNYKGRTAIPLKHMIF